MLIAGGTQILTAQDTFNRADGDPMTTTMTDGVSTWTVGPSSKGTVRIVSANARAHSPTSTEAGAVVLSPTFPTNQSAAGKITVSLAVSGIGVRLQSGTFSGYLLSIADSTHVKLSKMVDTGTVAYTTITNITVSSAVIGDTLRLEVSGTNFTIYQNNVSLGVTGDTTYQSGQPFIYFYGTSGGLQNFVAQNIP